MNDLNSYISELKKILDDADSKARVIEKKNIFVKERVKPLYEELKTASDKKSYGLFLNDLKKAIEETTNQYIISFTEDEAPDIPSMLFASEQDNFLPNGHFHILNKVLDDILAFFAKLSFNVVSFNEVVNPLYNFDVLNIKEDHPARVNDDSFYISASKMLRTHCTSTTAHFLMNNEDEDIRLLSYGNVYRKDDDDATHSHQFMQMDLVWVRDNLTVSNLKWLIDELIKYIFKENLTTRYRLSYFPFTEPSFEVDVSCFKCDKKGCALCKQTGWIEILGSGMLHPAVLENAGITKKRSAIAFGIGIDRIAMLKYNVDDIRYLYTNNKKFNDQI
ncbi:phenylalanine--tRNA ligase subunit alpha [Ureaplasma canigenitalium]|uniref:phenylalanine--tRNA ligase subunit alpha n=1 Tax=Ureaplasma canigenitalium TaxID=42092 RepID=UPI0004E247BD|nr:phenylalanine--tRNA ligase subunit alpha [Ureaplasma canigenitalium]